MFFKNSTKINQAFDRKRIASLFLLLITVSFYETLAEAQETTSSVISTSTTSLILSDCLVDIYVFPPKGGTTSPLPGKYFLQGCIPENWTICATPNMGFVFSHWEGTCNDSNELCCSASLRDVGYISATAMFIKQCCCLIENVYGEDSEKVKLLRYYRDNILSKTPEGRELIKLYYLWSPSIVKVIEENEEFKEEVKQMIDGVLPMIGEAMK